MSQGIIMIIGAIALIILLVWVFRSRFGAADHIDTSATAVGAVTEAARNIAEEVVHKFEGKHEPQVAAEAPVSVAAAPVAPAPAPAQAQVNTAPNAIGIPAAVGAPDNLRLLKGVGPKLAALLTELGITRFDQIAAWNAADIATVDANLGTFKGRIVRDNWVEQAGFLARGDTAGFEARFGKLDGPGNS
ncbi:MULTISPECIES: hypothetical protein [unclassified Sphingobium]|uniref:hypothetical protein n=1 Tax=unclassified Sphingobium TaxID=2611147 RepID=UPI002224DF26|nr:MULTISPECIES: hypothetical protein [unclassified Sphingobium]MCW2368797.1 putative flap endonuclease-1-like 5' DNA nuclease [Sphingobium sp. B11D3D]MCW2393803.1 putative flap endonuclease-1-like 5' DNA nuclease [Sphingobium sp. B8D3B]MCW2417317.1 putative flap endonuclease-1-like 5' DNA nuclease [Sphingobium sp. B8D3C]